MKSLKSVVVTKEVFSDEKEKRFFVVAYSDTYRCFFSGQFPNDDITHWTELPRTPKERGGEK
jgi:hypothetical protein